MGVKLLTVPAQRGSAWVKAGLAGLFAQLPGYTLLCLVFLVAAAVLSLVPVVGSVVLLAALPLFSLAFTMGTREAQAGRPITPALYLAPWRRPATRGPLAAVCLGYALATLLLVTLADTVDGGRFNELMQMATTQPDPEQMAEALANGGLLEGFMLRTLLIALLAVPFWHAPALVVWGGQGAAQALFSSTLALWRARGAYVLYGLGWAAVTVGVSLIGGLLLGVLGTAAGPWLLLPLSLLVTMAFYASLYPSYVDCFGPPDEVA